MEIQDKIVQLNGLENKNFQALDGWMKIEIDDVT